MKKIHYRYIVIIIATFFICLSLLTAAYGEDNTKKATAPQTVSPDLSKEVCQFIEVIYQDYSRGDFSYVYQKIHPLIKKELSEETYIEFQENNFQKYQLKISKVTVKSLVYLTKLPHVFDKYDILSSQGSIIEVDVGYQLNFNYIGGTKQEDIQKKVYLLMEEGRLYLLWDPSVIDKNMG